MVVKAAQERRNDQADDARLGTEPKRARRDAGAASVAARVKPVNRMARAKIVAVRKGEGAAAKRDGGDANAAAGAAARPSATKDEAGDDGGGLGGLLGYGSESDS